MKNLICLLLINLKILSSSSVSDEGIVEIENGKIRGELRNHFYAFEGIPYAQAPVGELRFASPKPFDARWDGVKDFLDYGAACIQWDHFQKYPILLIGEEDCLTINVYVPKSVSKPAPVFFFIPPGGFMFGGSESYGPRHFMKKNVILVSFNYRVGPMGFMSTEDDVIPGNMGLKDQVLALKWVRKNIESFGGDADHITIMGASAGGASVHYFYMSPMTQGKTFYK